jgi:hypothetical protein
MSEWEATHGKTITKLTELLTGYSWDALLDELERTGRNKATHPWYSEDHEIAVVTGQLVRAELTRRHTDQQEEVTA